MSQSSEPVHPPMSSPGQDIRKLKQSGGATVGELKEFLDQMRGKNAKEILGVMAQSGLVQGFVTATIAGAILLAILTVGPYAWAQMAGGEKEAAPAVAAEEAEQATEEGGQPEEAATAQTKPAADPSTLDPDSPQAQDITDSLGVGETREAPANVNPLEGAADDLLKDLD